MTVTADTLRELHRIHMQLSDLKNRLDRGPKQIRVREVCVTKIEVQLSEAQDSTRQSKMLANQKQLDLKTSENKILDLKAKLNACNTNKEYQTLLDQIAAAEMANSVLSDEILETLEQIDVLTVNVREAEKNVAAARSELAKMVEQVSSSTDAIQADISRLQAELDAAEGSLPPDFRVQYDRIIRSKKDDALAPAEDGVCTGCGQQITMNMQNDLAMSRAMFCKSCGRLLYLLEDRMPTG